MAQPTHNFPPSFADFSEQQKTDPKGSSQRLNQALQQAYQQLYALNDRELADIKTLTTQTNALSLLLVRAVSGSTLVTGSALAVLTGLKTVSNVIVSLDNSAVATNVYLSARPAGAPGTIDIFVWKPTANNDVTPIAGTVAIRVRWIAIGAP